ncbi:MAG: type II secretion system protein [Nitrospirota bacterium]
MKDEGMTLVELLVVISIIGILTVAMGFSFEGWMGRYRIESQIRCMYSDLMEARTKSMSRKMWHYMVLNTNNYQIFEDTNSNFGSMPDAGDISLWPGPKILQSGQLKMISADKFPLTLKIDTRGLIPRAAATISFRIDNNRDPEFDCILIDEARIRIGKTDMTGAVCNAK